MHLTVRYAHIWLSRRFGSFCAVPEFHFILTFLICLGPLIWTNELCTVLSNTFGPETFVIPQSNLCYQAFSKLLCYFWLLSSLINGERCLSPMAHANETAYHGSSSQRIIWRTGTGNNCIYCIVYCYQTAQVLCNVHSKLDPGMASTMTGRMIAWLSLDKSSGLLIMYCSDQSVSAAFMHFRGAARQV